MMSDTSKSREFRLWNILRGTIFLAIPFLVFLLLLEGGIRIYFLAKNRVRSPERNFEKYLGWKVVENDKSKHSPPGFDPVEYSTTKYGFRVFGDVETEKTKIFVLGDSFTQAWTVSDGQTYYDYIGNHGNAEIFAYGGAGYGTLQEYMILDKYIELIEPDIIIWQFCTNDFVNNVQEIEALSLANNNHMTRPYLVDGKIEWLYPTRYRSVFNIVAKHSSLMRFLGVRFAVLRAELGERGIEHDMKPGHPLFEKAVGVTSRILAMARERADDIPFCLFSSEYFHASEQSIRRVAEENGVYFIPGIPQSIDDAKEKGLRVTGEPDDLHWNTRGHEVVGKAILDFLGESSLIPRDNGKPIGD